MPIINPGSSSYSVIDSNILVPVDILTIFVECKEFYIFGFYVQVPVFISLKLSYRLFSLVYRQPIKIIFKKNLAPPSWQDFYSTIPLGTVPLLYLLSNLSHTFYIVTTKRLTLYKNSKSALRSKLKTKILCC